MTTLDPLQTWTPETTTAWHALTFPRTEAAGGPRRLFSTRFLMRPGDTYTDASLPATHPSKTTARCEVYDIPIVNGVPLYFLPGETWRFEWWMKPESPWPASDGATRWCSLAQWKQRGGGSPPLQLVNEGSANELRLLARFRKNAVGQPDTRLWAAPMADFIGKWTKLAAVVVFHSTNAGYVEFAVNDAVVKTAYCPVMDPTTADLRSYPKVGLYRGPLDHPGTHSMMVNDYRYWKIG